MSEGDFNPDLIDLVLRQLSQSEAATLEARMADDAKLRVERASVASALTALSSWKVAAPAGLADRVCAAVKTQSSRRSLRIAAAADDLDRGRVIRFANLREIFAVAAMVVLAVGIGVPSMLQMRDRAQRTLCSANLGQIGQAMQAYATAFNDSLPFAGWNPRMAWQPTGEPGVETAPNRRHLFPLVRQQQTLANLLVCPASKDVPMVASQIPFRNDFIEARNVSYAVQNMAGVRPSLKSSDPSLPIMSDDNPLFDGSTPLLNFVNQLGWRDASQTNSRAHGGAGENVLSLDGSVRWSTTPNVGVNSDNIWTLEHVEHYTGHEGPQTTTDSHLIK